MAVNVQPFWEHLKTKVLWLSLRGFFFLQSSKNHLIRNTDVKLFLLKQNGKKKVTSKKYWNSKMSKSRVYSNVKELGNFLFS